MGHEAVGVVPVVAQRSGFRGLGVLHETYHHKRVPLLQGLEFRGLAWFEGISCQGSNSRVMCADACQLMGQFIVCSLALGLARGSTLHVPRMLRYIFWGSTAGRVWNPEP